MLKKLFIYIVLIMIMTGCNKNEDDNRMLLLCNQINNDIKSYQNNEIERTELYSKLENYQDDCINDTTNVCITLNAIISIPEEKEDVKELFIKDLLKYCK